MIALPVRTAYQASSILRIQCANTPSHAARSLAPTQANSTSAPHSASRLHHTPPALLGPSSQLIRVLAWLWIRRVRACMSYNATDRIAFRIVNRLIGPRGRGLPIAIARSKADQPVSSPRLMGSEGSIALIGYALAIRSIATRSSPVVKSAPPIASFLRRRIRTRAH